ncbi:hypothetical protein B0T24DRAFT_609357, partial [Lasiosphaeria ovina]
MRSIGPFETTPNSFLIPGTVYETQTFVHVRWSWLTLLAGQLVLAFVFFVSTIVATSRLGAQVSKSSVLATIFALNPNVSIEDHAGCMEEAARSSKARVSERALLLQPLTQRETERPRSNL